MTVTEKTADKKALLRKKMRQLRAALSWETAARDSAAICEKILSSAEYANARRVLAYMPIQNEVSLLPVIGQALSGGKQVYLPAVNGKGMQFYRVRDLKTLQPGVFSIPEPAKDEPLDEADAALLAATLVLVPGLAFTKDGTRLGQGGGYYDRFLARFSGGVVWAVAYECQLAKSIPQEATDRRVDAVLTQCARYERNDSDEEK